jgi:hypothetical protein
VHRPWYCSFEADKALASLQFYSTSAALFAAMHRTVNCLLDRTDAGEAWLTAASNFEQGLLCNSTD